jgi:hypothetical protein
MAFDMVVAGMDPEAFKELGQLWQSWGGVWGGAFNDPIHFEYPGFTPGARGRDAAQISPDFLDRLEKLTEEYPTLSFLLGFVPYVGEAEIVAEAAIYGRKFARYLRGY